MLKKDKFSIYFYKKKKLIFKLNIILLVVTEPQIISFKSETKVSSNI